MKNPQPTHRHQPQSTIPKPVQPAPDPESKIHMILTFPPFFFSNNNNQLYHKA